MNRSFRVVLTGVTAAATLGLAACGSSSGSGSSGGQSGTFKVDFSNYTESAPLFRVIHTNLTKSVADTRAPVKVKWYDNNSDPATMLQNTQLMIADHPDALIIYPVSNATAGVGHLVDRSRLPCVAVNLNVPSCHFLNINNRALGVGTAKIVGKVAKERGWNASNTTVLIGQNAAAGEQVNDCVRYFYTTIAPMLGIKQVNANAITPKTTKIGTNAIQFDGSSQLQPSYQAVKNLLPSVPRNHHLILYTVNNDSTKGALRAIDDAGLGAKSNLLIGGLGGDQTGITALRNDPRWVAEGDIFVSWWGEYAVAMAQALAKGATPPNTVTALPQVVLDKQTVNDYHKPGSLAVKQLPPLDSSNSYLLKGSFLQQVHNIKGVH